MDNRRDGEGDRRCKRYWEVEGDRREGEGMRGRRGRGGRESVIGWRDRREGEGGKRRGWYIMQVSPKMYSRQ